MPRERHVYVIVDSVQERVIGPFVSYAHAAWWKDRDYPNRARLGIVTLEDRGDMAVSGPWNLETCPYSTPEKGFCIRGNNHPDDHDFPLS